MHIYISGSLAYDRIMNFPDKFSNHILPDKIHILNVCFLVQDLEEKFGGTAGNIAYSLSLLQERPELISQAGSDFQRYQDWLQKYGISLHGVRFIQDVPTASAYITTDQADNQITAFNPGAMNYPTNGFFKDFLANDSLAIVSPGNLEDMQQFPSIYRELGLSFILDPGQNIPAFSGEQLKSMLKGSRALIVNDYELSMVQEATGLDKPGLLQLTQAVITTLGEEGSLILETGQEEQRVPAAKVLEPVDPTGAGDAYRAGLIKGLAMGLDLAQAAKVASVCACYAVEHKGTQEHHFTPEEFWDRFQKNFGPL
ncbi:MAG: carbohydrate kinase family protein [Desulfohalobiaceae bacterium]